MSRFTFGGGARRGIRGEFAIGLLLVAAGIIGVAMLRAPQEAVVDAETSATTVPLALPAGKAFVSVALPVGAYPPQLAAGDTVLMFGTRSTPEFGTTEVASAASPALVHAVTGDPAGSDSVVTLLGDLALGEFLVATSDIRLVIVGVAP